MKIKNTRRFIAAALCAVLVLAFSGCGEDSSKTDKTPQISRQNSAESSVAEPVKEPDEQLPEEPSSQENSDEWLERMAVVDNKLSLVTKSEEYKNGNIETRHRLAENALKELEEQGYVRKGTIYYDGNSNISFTYECSKEGVLGGIMLKEFDPMFNGTDQHNNNSENSTVTADDTEFSGTYSDFVGHILKMPASESDYDKSDFYSFLKRDNSHWNLFIKMNDGIEKKHSVLSLEKQNSNGVDYYNVGAASDDKMLYNQTLYSADDKYYSAEEDMSSCTIASESDRKSVLDAFDLEKALGKDNEQVGLCRHEDETVVYRQFVSDNMVTVLFFGETGFIEGRIYTVNGYYDEKAPLPEAGNYGSLILSGKIIGSLDLPVDASLSEIPPAKQLEPDCGTIENYSNPT